MSLCTVGNSWGRNECASALVCLPGRAQAVGVVIRAGPMSTSLPGHQPFSRALWQWLEGVSAEKLGGKQAGMFKLLKVQFETLREVVR